VNDELCEKKETEKNYSVNLNDIIIRSYTIASLDMSKFEFLKHTNFP